MVQPVLHCHILIGYFALLLNRPYYTSWRDTYKVPSPEVQYLQGISNKDL
jgi:hypothetical protein